MFCLKLKRRQNAQGALIKMDPVKIVQRHKKSFKMAEVGKAAIWVVHIFLGPKIREEGQLKHCDQNRSWGLLA